MNSSNLSIRRQPHEAGHVWPEWEVALRLEDDTPHAAEVYRVEVRARDQEHARELVGSAGELVRVDDVRALDLCEGCNTCRTYGGCGSRHPKELPADQSPREWLARMCRRLALRLAFPGVPLVPPCDTWPVDTAVAV